MRQFQKLSVGVMAVLCAAVAVRAADPTYPIRFHRDFKPGDAFDTHITLDLSSTQTMTTPGAAPSAQETSVKGDITGRVNVTAVDKKGDPQTFTLTVGKFVVGKEGAEAVPAGKVLTIARTETDVTAALPNGEEINAAAMDVIRAYYHPVSKSNVSDDDVFGTKTAQAVGQSWPLNAENAAKNIAEDGLDVVAANLTGHQTLQEIKKVNGADAAHIVGVLEAKDFKPVDGGAVTYSDSHLKMAMDGLFPIDPTAPAAEAGIVMDLTMHANSGGAAIAITLHASKKETITPVKK